MTSNEYTELLARFRRLLQSGGEGNEPLPEFLRPENIQVSEEVGERARRLKESILKGDIETSTARRHMGRALRKFKRDEA